MYSFPNFEPVHYSISDSNCCFLTCVQVSQKAGQVVWYSHIFRNFPQFVVIHTVKGLFQSCSHCWVFQICWHIEYSTLTASFFRIWSSSDEIPSPPLALLVMMLPKVHLTLHSKMSGSGWVITPLWLSGCRGPAPADPGYSKERRLGEGQGITA